MRWTIDPRHWCPRSGNALCLTALAVAGVLAVFWTQFRWVAPTNFGGYDEWLLLNLSAQGIADSPNSNRPLGFFWHQPALSLARHSFESSFLGEDQRDAFQRLLNEHPVPGGGAQHP